MQYHKPGNIFKSFQTYNTSLMTSSNKMLESKEVFSDIFEKHIDDHEEKALRILSEFILNNKKEPITPKSLYEPASIKDFVLVLSSGNRDYFYDKRQKEAEYTESNFALFEIWPFLKTQEPEELLKNLLDNFFALRTRISEKGSLKVQMVCKTTKRGMDFYINRFPVKKTEVTNRDKLLMRDHMVTDIDPYGFTIFELLNTLWVTEGGVVCRKKDLMKSSKTLRAELRKLEIGFDEFKNFYKKEPAVWYANLHDKLELLPLEVGYYHGPEIMLLIGSNMNYGRFGVIKVSTGKVFVHERHADGDRPCR